MLIVSIVIISGISYSVNTQELLVERCLEDDQQLLDALAPDPILESDLLTLDDSTLKSELNDDIDLSTNVPPITTVESVSNNFVNDFTTNEDSKPSPSINPYTIETRKRRTDFYSEDELCKRDISSNFVNFFMNFVSVPCVYTIADKPILSRARASLPESYLQFGKVDDGK